jgi:hypothetical protein
LRSSPMRSAGCGWNWRRSRMAKQTAPINKQCQHSSQCCRDAVIGVYRWSEGETDVNLDRPVKVFCGPHKPRLFRGQTLRNVRIAR